MPKMSKIILCLLMIFWLGLSVISAFAENIEQVLMLDDYRTDTDAYWQNQLQGTENDWQTSNFSSGFILDQEYQQPKAGLWEFPNEKPGDSSDLANRLTVGSDEENRNLDEPNTVQMPFFEEEILEYYSYDMSQFVPNQNYGLFLLDGNNEPVSLNGRILNVGESFRLSVVFNVNAPVDPSHPYMYRLPSELTGNAGADQMNLYQDGQVIASIYVIGNQVYVEFTDYIAERVRAGQSFSLRYDFIETLNELLINNPGETTVMILTQYGYDIANFTVVGNQPEAYEQNAQAGSLDGKEQFSEDDGPPIDVYPSEEGLSPKGDIPLEEEPSSKAENPLEDELLSVGEPPPEANSATEGEPPPEDESVYKNEPSTEEENPSESEPSSEEVNPPEDEHLSEDDSLFEEENSIEDITAEEEQIVSGQVSVERYTEDIIRVGYCFILKATVDGLDNMNYTAQWQYDAGEGWTDVQGGNGLMLAVVANQNNINFNWRILVTPIQIAT